MRSTPPKQPTDDLPRSKSWRRVLLIALFCVIYWGVGWLLGAIVVLQVGWLLVTGEKNAQLARFGRNLGEYVRHLVFYLTAATEDLPFPFTEWPVDPGGSGHSVEETL